MTQTSKTSFFFILDKSYVVTSSKLLRTDSLRNEQPNKQTNKQTKTKTNKNKTKNTKQTKIKINKKKQNKTKQKQTNKQTQSKKHLLGCLLYYARRSSQWEMNLFLAKAKAAKF